jgi:hypothetical protein
MKHLYEYLEFDKLSEVAKENAIENVREEKYKGGFGGNDLGDWAIDDDALFEPDEKEMISLFGPNYYENNGDRFMIENSRKKISFVGMDDPNYYIHCANAIDVTNDNLFYRWLGIPIRYAENLYYSFDDPGRQTNTTINIEIDGDEEEIFGPGGAPESFMEIIEKAENKFNKHISLVLKRISNSIDSQFEDDGIIDTIESHEILFDEDGNIQ